MRDHTVYSFSSMLHVCSEKLIRDSVHKVFIRDGFLIDTLSLAHPRIPNFSTAKKGAA